MGSLEIGFALASQNPLLLAGGIQNMLAGLVATYQTVSVYIDPLDFFGAGGTSALIGFAVAHGLAGQSLQDATLTALRSGSIGALFAVSTAFGFGAITGFAACQLGRALAQSHNLAASQRLTVDRHSYQLLVNELVAGNPLVAELLEKAMPQWSLQEAQPLQATTALTIKDSFATLSTTAITLNAKPIILNDVSWSLSAAGLTLGNEPDELHAIYRQAGLR